MGSISIVDWAAMPKEFRPAVQFYSEDVLDVKSGNNFNYTITTTGNIYDRDYGIYLQLKPIELSGMRLIEGEELVLELTRAQDTYRTECTIDGKWAPAAVISTGSRLIYVAQTDDGLRAYSDNISRNNVL